MFKINRKNNSKSQDLDKTYMAEQVELTNDNKTIYYEEIVQTLNLIDLEKKMQDRLERLM